MYVVHRLCASGGLGRVLNLKLEVEMVGCHRVSVGNGTCSSARAGSACDLSSATQVFF